jgi:hypothetical protein
MGELSGGKWRIEELLKAWQSYVQGLEGWEVHRHEGYRAVTVDTTAFFRPALANCPSQHYHPAAKRALPAVIFGIAGEVGEIGDQRLACPRIFERVHPKDPSETRLWREILRRMGRDLAEDEVIVVDAGSKFGSYSRQGLAVRWYAWRPILPPGGVSMGKKCARCPVNARANSLRRHPRSHRVLGVRGTLAPRRDLGGFAATRSQAWPQSSSLPGLCHL